MGIQLRRGTWIDPQHGPTYRQDDYRPEILTQAIDSGLRSRGMLLVPRGDKHVGMPATAQAGAGWLAAFFQLFLEQICRSQLSPMYGCGAV